MEIPPPSELIEMVCSLPAVAPLLECGQDLSHVYLVGGAVRDLLLGGRPVDLDLVVEGNAEAFARSLGEPRIYDRFGTSTVELAGFLYDIAQARSESYSRPGALPDVAPARLKEDLGRRDFTVNAMAIALAGDRAGALETVSLSLSDLESGALRVLHPRSFVDDPTRLLRLARYASRLGFAIEPHTRELAAAAIGAGALNTVSGARVGTELRLAAREADPVAALEGLGGLGIDRALHPGFGLTDPGLARRALALLPPGGRRDALVLAAAAMGVGAELPALLDALAFTAEDRARIAAAALDAPSLADALGRAARPSEIARAVGAGPAELVALAGALGPADAARRWLTDLINVRLQIDGSDLLDAGVAQGPAVGRGLAAALEAKLDGQAPARDAELARAVEAATSSG